MAIVALALLAVGLVGYQVFRGGDEHARTHKWEHEVGDGAFAVAELETAFANVGYDFGQVKSGQIGVPRVLVRTMPADLGQVPEVDRRKALFLGSVLPLVLAVNEQILSERKIVEDIGRKIQFQQPLTANDRAELQRLARIYRIIEDSDEALVSDTETPEADLIKAVAPQIPADELVDELLLRAAPLPVSLVLAQAAEESAWGLSRFASEGNALYGQWVWNDELGIIPKQRAQGQTHSVRAFRDILESTLSYAHNLNTHRAYQGFRRMRANMLTATGHLDGYALAGALTKYSGRGQAYVEALRTIMRSNDLKALDRAKFTDQMTTRTAEADTAQDKSL